jgi:predicted restriction endonuclease
MSLADIDEGHVLRAIREFDDLGRESFLSKYGFGAALRYVVLYKGAEYDSKALVGAAHGYATGRPLLARDFSGGVQTVVSRLTALGFDFRDLRLVPKSADEDRYGEMPGYPVGSTFKDRIELSQTPVHRARQAGIVGTGKLGAESIVSSGGYEDDDDRGWEIVYTGHGGQENGRQIADQTFDASGNAALVTSMMTGAPVRVVRGPDRRSPHAPDEGFRYDGLFRVEDASLVRGQSGFLVCRFQMVRLTDAVDLTQGPDYFRVSPEEKHPEAPVGNEEPGRRSGTVQRIVRSTKTADYVKEVHDHTCQMCGLRLSVGDGRGYSEGAHIQALGGLHRGPDKAPNVLCLCPNCHVQFDRGVVTINADRTVMRDGVPEGTLREHELHQIDEKYLEYHRMVHSRISNPR